MITHDGWTLTVFALIANDRAQVGTAHKRALLAKGWNTVYLTKEREYLNTRRQVGNYSVMKPYLKTDKEIKQDQSERKYPRAVGQAI